MNEKFNLGDIVRFTTNHVDYCGVVTKVFRKESNVVGINWDSGSPRVDNYKWCIRHATEEEIKQRLVNILKGKHVS